MKDIEEIEHLLTGMLKDAVWNSTKVRFAKPYVNRLWTVVEGTRVCLHEILPCNTSEAMWHSHPWDAEFKLISGKQEVGFGFDPYKKYHAKGYTLTPLSEAGISSPSCDRVEILTPGDTYYMPAIVEWHYVRPIDAPSWSIMINGREVEKRNPVSGLDEDRLKEEWSKLVRV